MRTEHYNGLTEAEAERLAMLAEEAAEVIHVVGKILRHGYEQKHPDKGTTNRENLRSEMIDFGAVQNALFDSGDIKTITEIEKHNVWHVHKMKWARHQEPPRATNP